ncbi:MAG: hypothetical protein LBF60_09280 [Treponema sp.]|nr:hypothetical protein [Treponema sp.]
MKAKSAFVNAGTDHDASGFAVAFIRAWRETEDSAAYPQAEYMQILADGRGSNGSQRRRWNYEPHRLSNETGIPIRVCHYPPGTSKRNKIEHC